MAESTNKELFELCKKVYELTGWGQYGDEGLPYFHEQEGIARKDLPPIYTSDYLLEKLPKKVKGGYWLMMAPLDSFEPSWEAGYYMPKDRLYSNYEQFEDTILKALLKLTVALAEAGELERAA